MRRPSRLASLLMLLCFGAPVAALPAPEAPLPQPARIVVEAQGELPVLVPFQGGDGPPAISAQELLRRLRAEPAKLLILDVRTPEEFADGHVPGAVNIPHDRIGERIAEVRDAGDVDIVLYCRSGRRAGMAAETLDRAGIGRLLHLDGDMLGWLEKDLPVEKGSGDGS